MMLSRVVAPVAALAVLVAVVGLLVHPDRALSWVVAVGAAVSVVALAAALISARRARR